MRAEVKIKIIRAEKIMDFAFKFTSENKTWRKVSIYCTEFVSMSSFLNFIEIIENSVENLRLQSVSIKDLDVPTKQFEFKSLKSLQISTSEDFAIGAMFSKVSTLTKMKINFFSNLEEAEFARQILQKQINLKCLKCKLRNVEELFPKHLKSSYPFQLKTLKINGIFLYFMEFDSNENFKHFLKAQTKLAAVLGKIAIPILLKTIPIHGSTIQKN
jgi:hypothetical protein